METTITLSAKNQARSHTLSRIAEGRLSMADGASLLGLSERQLWRLRRAVGEAGPAGLVHGNTGRASPRRIDPLVRALVVELATTTYAGVNDSHLAELLVEREAIAISRPSLRRILRSAGRASPRRRRAPAHRSRRPRMAAEGLLLQLDGSRHDWLEGRGPGLTLIGAIDDATGLVTAAVFRDQEDAAGYLEILAATVARYGLPGAIYRDRAGIFAPTTPGRAKPDAPSQVGRALAELGIGSIVAGSPQAKGRIERLWGTCQDRLVIELRLAGISDRAEANVFLASYLERHNARFAVPAADPVPAWRALPAEVSLERVFVFKYRRKVARDHTINLGGRVLALPQVGRAGYTGQTVEVHVRLDGSIVAFDGRRELAVALAPLDPVQLRAARGRREEPGIEPEPATLTWVPPAEHPWRRVRTDTALYQTRLTESLTT
jgi:hypothetical protein